MNSSEVKIKARPNELMRFPAVCVHCARPATEQMSLKKRDGRLIRQVDVPLCEDCAGHLRRRSAGEERWHKLGSILSAVLGIIAALILLIVLPLGGFWARLLLASLLGLGFAAIVYRLSQLLADRAALPQKKAIRSAAKLESFSWRTVTLILANDTFRERFVDLNESQMMEPM